MIQPNDRILVGLSGGADSLVLCWLLNERRSRAPIHYELTAVYLDPGFTPSFAEALAEHCLGLKINFNVEYTDYGRQGHSPQNRENPCFLCSRLRRKRLFEIAAETGCTKLALGHNKDDIIETLFINMCYAGEISTMLPRQSLFGDRITIIRPLAYADEELIRTVVAEKQFPAFKNPCPAAAGSRRRHVKLLLQQLYRSNDKIKGNIFRALHHVRPDYLPNPASGGIHERHTKPA
jgi:tRNA 2-thiocytidine biosynthesis protein TtcA